MREWQQAIEAACEAVRRVSGEHLGFALALIAPDDAIAAIRALPAPEPVGEDELVSLVCNEIHPIVVHRYATGSQASVAVVKIARAALRVVREHDRREADEPCDVCAGTGTPVSGGECACGGSGKLSDTATTLRKELYSARREADELRRELNEHLESTEGVRGAIVQAQEELRDVREVLREVLSSRFYRCRQAVDGHHYSAQAELRDMLPADRRNRAESAAQVKP